MKDADIHPIIRCLRREVKNWKTPIIGVVAATGRTPYRILISTILSLRTQDTTTAGAVERLFKLADTPTEMLKLSAARIEKLIYPVGFYRTKAKNLLEVTRLLFERYGGAVPDDVDELCTLPGVGRKTANLVATVGYGKPGICVDTHVHRISNRWGYIRTKTPDDSEKALRAKLPKPYWIEYNDLLVPMGQYLCRPQSPKCSECRVAEYCDRVGVERSR